MVEGHPKIAVMQRNGQAVIRGVHTPDDPGGHPGCSQPGFCQASCCFPLPNKRITPPILCCKMRHSRNVFAEVRNSKESIVLRYHDVLFISLCDLLKTIRGLLGAAVLCFKFLLESINVDIGNQREIVNSKHTGSKMNSTLDCRTCTSNYDLSNNAQRSYEILLIQHQRYQTVSNVSISLDVGGYPPKHTEVQKLNRVTAAQGCSLGKGVPNECSLDQGVRWTYRGKNCFKM